MVPRHVTPRGQLRPAGGLRSSRRVRAGSAQRAVLSLLVALRAALPGAAASCLPDAVPPSRRVSLDFGGRGSPFRILPSTSASAQLLGELVAILAAEVLGYDTAHELTPVGEEQYQPDAPLDAFLALMGCARPWVTGPVPQCSPLGPALAEAHAALEVPWAGLGGAAAAGLDCLRAALPALFPEGLGTVGYVGERGIYVKRSDIVQLQLVVNADPSWYWDWKATSHRDMQRVFANRSALPEPMRCQEVRAVWPDIAQVERDGLRCIDRWWAWGECAGRSPPLSDCIPIAVNAGVDLAPLRVWNSHNMTAVFGVYSDLALYQRVARGNVVPFYTYSPSLQSAPLHPVRIRFPEHDDADWEGAFPTTDPPGSILTKLAVRGLGEVAPKLVHLLAGVRVTPATMRDMLASVSANGSVSGVACQWLLANAATWRTWLPDPRECSAGEGLDGGGAGCAACTPGTFSARSAADGMLRCRPCLPGTYQDLPGRTECQSCAAGEEAPDPRARRCVSCGVGSFRNGTQGGACESCPAGLTTLQAGSQGVQQCVCLPGTYAVDALGTGCSSCPVGWTTTAGAVSKSECALKKWVVALICVALCGSCASVASVAAWRWRIKRAKARATEERLQAGLSAVAELGHPFICMSACNFIQLQENELRRYHEGARNSGKLLVLDTIAAVLAFKEMDNLLVLLSYEWLSWSRCGPDHVQFAAMRQAIKNLRDRKGVDLDHTHIWLDVLSIPQRHTGLKALAIQSLYLYASLVDVVLVIAPPSKHQGSGAPADLQSYRTRVWCRAEQVAHICHHGEESVYIQCSVDGGLEGLPENWFLSVLCVFEGEMTCCRKMHVGWGRCDRESLVPMLLGLYYSAYAEHLMGIDGPGARVYEMIVPVKERVFPRNFLHVSTRGTHQRELFGDMVRIMEKLVEADPSAAWQRARAALAVARINSKKADQDIPQVSPWDMVRVRLKSLQPPAGPAPPIPTSDEEEEEEEEVVGMRSEEGMLNECV